MVWVDWIFSTERSQLECQTGGDANEFTILVLQILLKLTLHAPTPQNGQSHSKNSSATADELLGVFDHFVGLALTGLNDVPDQSNDPSLEEHFEQ